MRQSWHDGILSHLSSLALLAQALVELAVSTGLECRIEATDPRSGLIPINLLPLTALRYDSNIKSFNSV